jgi:hypothetical protein
MRRPDRSMSGRQIYLALREWTYADVSGDSGRGDLTLVARVWAGWSSLLRLTALYAIAFVVVAVCIGGCSGSKRSDQTRLQAGTFGSRAQDTGKLSRNGPPQGRPRRSRLADRRERTELAGIVRLSRLGPLLRRIQVSQRQLSGFRSMGKRLALSMRLSRSDPNLLALRPSLVGLRGRLRELSTLQGRQHRSEAALATARAVFSALVQRAAGLSQKPYSATR